MSDPSPSAVELVRRIARGDADAFAAFYDAWFDRAHALARSLTHRDEAFCLDVVQDTMLRLIRRPPSPQSEAALAQWFARTLLHRALDRIRSDRRRQRRESAAARDERCDAPVPGVATELGEWLGAQLAALPDEDRILLQARFGDGLSLAGAGARIGIGVNAAHGRIRRTLERLRRAAGLGGGRDA
jgi:RNA polymerase sigma-70 factor (ECF subfamily)